MQGDPMSTTGDGQQNEPLSLPAQDAIRRSVFEVADHIQKLCTSLITAHTRSVTAAANTDAATEDLREIMSNVAATVDALEPEDDGRALLDRLTHLVRALDRAVDEDGVPDEAAQANEAVALASSRRLLEPAATAADALTAAAAAPAAGPLGPAQADRSRVRQVLTTGGVAAVVVVVGLVGFAVGDASDNDEAAAHQASAVGDIKGYMATINAFDESWQPRLRVMLKTNRKPQQAECDGQLQALDQWPRELDSVQVNDTILREAGSRFVAAMRTVAAQCKGTTLSMRKAYLGCSELLADVRVRAQELGWSRSG